jgi:hypothetical protein
MTEEYREGDWYCTDEDVPRVGVWEDERDTIGMKTGISGLRIKGGKGKGTLIFGGPPLKCKRV